MKKNILIILLDGCRSDRLGCYGYTQRNTTPNIDALAENALVALNNYSTSFCTMPAITSMMTGLYPCVHKATATWGYYDGQYPYLTEILQSQGYQTFGISNNVVTFSPEWGFVRGYDRYFRIGKEINWFKESEQEKRTLKRTPLKVKLKRFIFKTLQKYCPMVAKAIHKKSVLKYYQATDMGGRKAVDTLKQAINTLKPGKPFFGYINLPDTHHPYFVPEPFLSKWGKLGITDNLMAINLNSSEFIQQHKTLNAKEIETLNIMYDACVAYNDFWVGEITQFLKEQKLYDNTAILLVGDHGGMLFEKEDHFASTCTTYEPEIKVPLILVNGKESKRITQLTSLIDVFPTLLEVAEIDPKLYSNISGKSLFKNPGHTEIIIDYPAYPTWLKKAHYSVPIVLIKYGYTNRTMITEEGYKLIWKSTGDHELYYLKEDPKETHNLFHSDFDVLTKSFMVRMKGAYQSLIGSYSEHLEYYAHNEVGEKMVHIPPLSKINPQFKNESIIYS